MEPYIVDFIYDKRIPKIIRDLVIILISGFIVYVGVECTLHSKMLIGNILGFLLVLASIAACIYIIHKIHKE